MNPQDYSLRLLIKCGPLANDSAALILAAVLFDASTILLNSSCVFLRKLPLDGFDTCPIISYMTCNKK